MSEKPTKTETSASKTENGIKWSKKKKKWDAKDVDFMKKL